MGYADFYALMPSDNADSVAPGTDVSFPRTSSNDGTITRVTDDSFNLPEIGTYKVEFSVPVNQAGQLVLTLNGDELDYTVAGRASGASGITGISLITTTAVNSVITLRNPADNPSSLIITPSAGGTQPVSAHLVITRIA